MSYNSIQVGAYAHNDSFYYTGTQAQPDVINVFFKLGEKEHVALVFMPLANFYDWVPILSFFSAIPRIVNSVEIFFRELSQATFQSDNPHLLESWNAFKNLIRGSVAIFPIAGNITLFVFDVVRTRGIYSKIENSLENQQNVMGVAFEGTSVFTTSEDSLTSIDSPSDPLREAVYLTNFQSVCTRFLETTSDQETIRNFFLRLSNTFAVMTQLGYSLNMDVNARVNLRNSMSSMNQHGYSIHLGGERVLFP